MAFRNNTEAENLRLKAQLEEKERALKEVTDKLNKLENNDDLKTKLVKESWFARKLREREGRKLRKEQAKFQEALRRTGTYRSSYKRRSRPFDWGSLFFVGLVVFFVIFVICHSIYRLKNYFNDFQSGTVVDRERIPGHMSCSGRGKDHECHWVPESFHLTIQNEQGETATWGVTSGEYHSVESGDYFCYTDLFHDADGCTPSTSSSEREFH